MSIDTNRFDKECLIEILKRKFTPTKKFYRWHTMSSVIRCDDGSLKRRYIAVGPRIAQEIIKCNEFDEISIEDYVYNYGCGFLAESSVYRPPSYEVLNHRKERHTINASLRKKVHSKGKRKQHRKTCKRVKIDLKDFFSHIRTK